MNGENDFVFVFIHIAIQLILLDEFYWFYFAGSFHGIIEVFEQQILNMVCMRRRSF